MPTAPDSVPIESHPRHRLDEVIHSALRLSIVSALSAVEKAEFRAVRDAVEISDSLLSKQVALLERAGYVDVHKDRVGRRPRTWLALNQTGREALSAHLSALADITRGHPLTADGVGHPTVIRVPAAQA